MTSLLYGLNRERAAAAVAPAIDIDAADELALAEAQIYYVLFEIPMAAARDYLPTALHPSVPAHLGITFWRVADGPLGRFEFAFIGIACRSGIKPRHLIYGAFTDSECAQNYFRTRYGYPCQIATVRQRENYDCISGEILQNDKPCLRVTTSAFQAVIGAGATVKYSPSLNLVTASHNTKLAQLEASYEFQRVVRGEPRIVHFDAARLGAPSIHATFPMSGTHAVCQIALHPVRFLLDVAIPAEAGGVERIRR